MGSSHIHNECQTFVVITTGNPRSLQTEGTLAQCIHNNKRKRKFSLNPLMRDYKGLYTEWDINPAYKGDFSYVFLSSPRDDYNLFLFPIHYWLHLNWWSFIYEMPINYLARSKISSSKYCWASFCRSQGPWLHQIFYFVCYKEKTEEWKLSFK